MPRPSSGKTKIELDRGYRRLAAALRQAVVVELGMRCDCCGWTAGMIQDGRGGTGADALIIMREKEAVTAKVWRTRGLAQAVVNSLDKDRAAYWLKCLNCDSVERQQNRRAGT